MRFLESELPDVAPEDARFHVLPVPYEKTVSYGGGTAKGPAAIIAASSQLERWDGASDPGAEGIYTWPAIDCSAPGPQVIEAIAAAVAKILSLGKMPVVLGGEHTVTGGVIRGYLEAGRRDFGVVQIDAHADLREAYEGDPLSHASVMRRVVEAGVPLVQLGNRAYCEEERAARSTPISSYPRASGRSPCRPISRPRCFSRSTSTAWIPLSCRPQGRPFPVGWAGTRPWDCSSPSRNRGGSSASTSSSSPRYRDFMPTTSPPPCSPTSSWALSSVPLRTGRGENA